MARLPKSDRRAQIEDIALTLLSERGYDATSMLAIARAAKASNETLYRWYGDKRGLFGALVARNAAQTRAALDSALEAPSPQAALISAGEVLLTMLLSDRAILLGRAAAGDATGELGAVLAAEGRDSIAPLIVPVWARLVAPACEATETFLALLIGDSQIRRVAGALPPPDPDKVRARAERAVRQTLTLYGS